MYIYIHIPFCTTICNYCDFPKLLYDKKYTNTYLDILEQEIESRYQHEKVRSIFIGGGTPTSLEYFELKKLLEITKKFSREEKIEFTVESNVESLNLKKIKLLKSYGVNRISLGVQSFQKETLDELNRHHTKEMVIEVINNLKQEGFINISIDYIYGIQKNIEEVIKDINTFLSLDIPHISCYSLIIEENTIFGIQKKEYIEEELEYLMYQKIQNMLVKKHYYHYEVSNYAKKGYESKHNLNYWNNGQYYGFGLGAVSYLNHYRIQNTKSIKKYLKNDYIDMVDYEDDARAISNCIILGLRKVNGINILQFRKQYQKDILDLYNIKELIQEGKLEIKNNHLRIPSKYFYLSNEILINLL